MSKGAESEGSRGIKGTGIKYGYKGKGVGGVVELRMQGVGSFARLKDRGGVLQWLRV